MVIIILRTEKDDKQLSCHDAEEHRERIDRRIAHRSLVILVRQTLRIAQSRSTCHGTNQKTYHLEIVDYDDTIGFGGIYRI